MRPKSPSLARPLLAAPLSPPHAHYAWFRTHRAEQQAAIQHVRKVLGEETGAVSAELARAIRSADSAQIVEKYVLPPHAPFAYQ